VDDILKQCMLKGLRYYRDETRQMLAMASQSGDPNDAERLERRIHRLDDRIRDWDLESRQMH
jgi:hypothetical protein